MVPRNIVHHKLIIIVSQLVYQISKMDKIFSYPSNGTPVIGKRMDSTIIFWIEQLSIKKLTILPIT